MNGGSSWGRCIIVFLYFCTWQICVGFVERTKGIRAAVDNRELIGRSRGTQRALACVTGA